VVVFHHLPGEGSIFYTSPFRLSSRVFCLSGSSSTPASGRAAARLQGVTRVMNHTALHINIKGIHVVLSLNTDSLFHRNKAAAFPTGEVFTSCVCVCDHAASSWLALNRKCGVRRAIPLSFTGSGFCCVTSYDSRERRNISTPG